MPSRDGALAGLRRFLQREDEAKFDWGYLGRENSAGTSYEFHVPEQPGYVYCQVQRGLAIEHTVCVPRVALNPYVRCKFKTVRGVLVAFEFDPLDGVSLYGTESGGLDLPAYPVPEWGAVVPPPTFGDPVIKLISSGVASAGDDRFLLLAAESSTTDDCDGLTGLAVGDEAWLFADAGDTITLRHNSGSPTDKFQFYNEEDIEITEQKGLRVVKRASGAIVNSADLGGGGGAFTDLTDVPASYSGQALKLARVKSAEDGLEFINPVIVGGSGSLERITATPLYENLAPTSGKYDLSNSAFDDYDRLELFLENAESTVNATADSGHIEFATGGGALDTTATNYYTQNIGGSNGAAVNAEANNQVGFIVSGSSASTPAGYASSVKITIFNPGDTSFHKRVLVEMVVARDSANMDVRFYSFFWRNTGAIDRIGLKIFNDPTSTFTSTTRLSIYGYKKEVIGGLALSDANVSNPPTDAELTSAFGAQNDGFQGEVDDAGAGTTVWRVSRRNGGWHYWATTKAT
jgi:hypothetical protein